MYGRDARSALIACRAHDFGCRMPESRFGSADHAISGGRQDVDQEGRHEDPDGHVRHRRPAREDPQRGARRPLRLGQDDAGRGPAGRDGNDPRAGTVADGTTVSDHDPVEVAQQRSVALSVCPLRWDNVVINLLDTPGLPGLHRRTARRLRAADAALFVVSAADEIDPITVSLWEECAALGTRARSSSPSWTRRAPTCRRRWPRASRCSAARTARPCCRCTCRRRRAGAAAHGPGRPAHRYRRTTTRRLPAQGVARRRPSNSTPSPRRADRGDHQQQRGRVAARPLPGRRGHRPGRPHRRPGDRGRARHVLPGAAGVRGHRAGPWRVARGAVRRVPVAGRARPRRRRRTWTASRGRPDLRPERPAAGRGRPHVGRPVPGPAVDPAGVLRDAHRGDRDPRLRPRRRRTAATPTTTPTNGSARSSRRWGPRCARSNARSPATSARSAGSAPRRPATPSPPRRTRC